MNVRAPQILMLFAFLAIACLSASSFGQMIVNISSSKDNTLYEDVNGGLSNGAGDHIFAGTTGGGSGNAIRRGLLAFDVAGNIPAGANIISVTLSLNMSRSISGNQTVTLHKVLSDWGEGTSHAGGEEGGGAPATPNDATWLHTFYNTAFWTNAGGDFDASVSASQSVGFVGAYTWGSSPEMVADVQDWLDNPATNFGWLLMCNESVAATAKRFDTKENPTVANRPLLTVNYTPPTGIGDLENGLPEKFELAQNYPNPFNPSTNIGFRISNLGFVSLKVYDNSGKEIATLVADNLPAGNYKYTWDAREFASGVYFYRLNVDGASAVRKMLLVR